jgi:hypothetical protein
MFLSPFLFYSGVGKFMAGVMIELLLLVYECAARYLGILDSCLPLATGPCPYMW